MLALRCFRISALDAEVLLRLGPSFRLPEQYEEPSSRLLPALWITELSGADSQTPTKPLGQAAVAGLMYPWLEAEYSCRSGHHCVWLQYGS